MILAVSDAITTHEHTASQNWGRGTSDSTRQRARPARGLLIILSLENARCNTLEQNDGLGQLGNQLVEVLETPLEAIVISTVNKVVQEGAQRPGGGPGCGWPRSRHKGHEGEHHRRSAPRVRR